MAFSKYLVSAFAAYCCFMTPASLGADAENIEKNEDKGASPFFVQIGASFDAVDHDYIEDVPGLLSLSVTLGFEVNETIQLEGLISAESTYGQSGSGTCTVNSSVFGQFNTDCDVDSSVSRQMLGLGGRLYNSLLPYPSYTRVMIYSVSASLQETFNLTNFDESFDSINETERFFMGGLYYGVEFGDSHEVQLGYQTGYGNDKVGNTSGSISLAYQYRFEFD